LFYCVVSAAGARVITIVLSTYITVLGSMVAFLLGSRKRSSLRRYLTYLKFDGLTAIAIQVLVFFLILGTSYARLQLSDLTNAVGAVIVLVVLGYFLRIPALISSPKILRRRMRNPSRGRFAAEVKIRLLALVVALLVLFAYALGTKRFEYLATQPEIKMLDAKYSTSARILASTGEDVLAFEICAGGVRRYIFLTPERVFASPVNCNGKMS